MREAATASSAARAGAAGVRVEAAAVAMAREARPVIHERLEGSAGF